MRPESLDETSKYLNFSNEMFPEAIDCFGDLMEELMPEVDYGRKKDKFYDLLQD